MSQTELNLAALQRVVDEHAGSGVDLRRLRRALALCKEIDAALDDDYCRRKLLLVEESAAELFSAPRPRGALSGADYLRRRIREALELVQSRLYTLAHFAR
jgi:hypothetical protein